MAIKQIIKMAAVVGSLILSGQVMAKGPVSNNNGFYGGVGMGGTILTGGDYAFDFSALMISGTIGYEDMGWAVEAKIAEGRDITEFTELDSISSVGLAYRSIEKNGRYYKIKVGQAEFFDGIDSERVIGLGIGFRADRDSRVELEYEYIPFGISDFGLDLPVHMISMNYLFGGASYNSRGMEGKSPLYAGVFAGMLDAGVPGFDNALGYGFLIGYGLSGQSGLAVEFAFTITEPASSVTDEDPNDGFDEGDEYDTASYGLYLAYRTPGKTYLKGKAGFLNSYEKDEIIVNGVTTDLFITNETGVSAGIGAGMKLKDDSRIEVDLTITSLESNGFSWEPMFLSVGYIF